MPRIPLRENAFLLSSKLPSKSRKMLKISSAAFSRGALFTSLTNLNSDASIDTLLRQMRSEVYLISITMQANETSRTTKAAEQIVIS